MIDESDEEENITEETMMHDPIKRTARCGVTGAKCTDYYDTGERDERKTSAATGIPEVYSHCCLFDIRQAALQE